MPDRKRLDHRGSRIHLRLAAPVMSFREELPPSCPPPESLEITRDLEVFRVTRNRTPADDDFHSLQHLNPQRDFGEDACRARGLSVNTVREHAVRLLLLPRFKGRAVCRVRLTVGAGHIQQTGRWSHHTWWPRAEFNILAACVEDAA